MISDWLDSTVLVPARSSLRPRTWCSGGATPIVKDIETLWWLRPSKMVWQNCSHSCLTSWLSQVLHRHRSVSACSVKVRLCLLDSYQPSLLFCVLAVSLCYFFVFSLPASFSGRVRVMLGILRVVTVQSLLQYASALSDMFTDSETVKRMGTFET